MLVGAFGLALNFYVLVPFVMTLSETNPHPRGFPDALVYFFTFFTHLANFGVLLIYLSELVAWRWLAWFRRPVTHALMAGNIALVIAYFHFFLAPYYHFEGLLAVGNVILHYVAPLLFLGWWALLSPHGSLRFADIPAMLVPGLIYLAWALGRGAVIGEYPYPVLDVQTNGYPQVAMGAGTIVAAVAAFCAILVLADKALARAKANSPDLA